MNNTLVTSILLSVSNRYRWIIIIGLGLPFFAIATESPSIGRRLFDSMDRQQTEWVQSYSQQYQKDICGTTYTEIGPEGFSAIRSKAERASHRCYAFDHLPRQRNLDFSSYQNITEEVFFDALIRSRMDNLLCKQYSLRCLGEKKLIAATAKDFVDRVKAFQLYRSKYREVVHKKNSTLKFTEEEQKILSKYFPGTLKDPNTFFEEWAPVTAYSALVTYINPGSGKGFPFQEALASLVEDDEMLEQFSRLTTKEQHHEISKLIEETSERQLSAIEKEREGWLRSCRTEGNPKINSDGSSYPKKEDCFFRPTHEQKMKLVDQFLLNTPFDPNVFNDTKNSAESKNLSKEEKSFFCSIALRYGKGAKMFDARMEQAAITMAFLPPMRSVYGFMAARSTTARWIAETAQSKLGLAKVLKGTSVAAKATGKIALYSQIQNLWDKCNKPKLKPAQPPTLIPTKTRTSLRQASNSMEECKNCQSQPRTRQVLDQSCAKEISKWFMNQVMAKIPQSGTTTAVDKITTESKDKPLVAQKMEQAQEALSMFFYNLSLTTDVDVPSLPEITDDIEELTTTK